jgi:hypothetical protein
VCKPIQPLAAAVGEAMRHAVDRVHPAWGRTVYRKAEHAYHAIDIDE